jgi:Ca-activated chloride channel family protein
MSNGFDFSLVATRPALMSGNNNIVDVLIRLQAPDAPKTGLPERQPVNLAIVIDRSGSMSGQPLHEAKRAASFMIDCMKPTDRACIVAYDDSVRVVAESRPVEDKAHFRRAISAIHSGGSTNLHGGWLKGAEEAAGHLSPSCTSRVLLLSDGQANVGLTDIDEIATQCAQLAEKSVTTSTYGLGNSFNEELMVAMSRSGRGNGYYSETAESLLERFQEEFSLLSALCGRNVRLFLSPLPGIRCEMLNLYERATDGSWRLPDLAYDGEVWAAVRLHVESESIPAVGESLAILRAHAAYVDLEGIERQISEVWLTLPVLEKDRYLAISENEDARRRVIEAEASRLQDSAGRAARNGDWNQVQELMSLAKDMAGHSPWLSDIVENLEKLAERQDDVLFSKEAMFASMHLSHKQRSKREFDPDFADASAPTWAQRKVQQGRSGHYGAPVREQRYELDLFDNHPVALIEGKRVLLDTGSPFSVGDGSELKIAGNRFSPGSQMGVTPEQLSRWMNTQIDALLGTDILSEFGVSVDWWKSEVTFAPSGTNFTGLELPMKLLMGTPVLRFEGPGGMTDAIFDTGAKLCYMPRSAVQGRCPVNHLKDFHPMIGPFETDVYELEIEIAGRSFVANCGVLPDSMTTLLSGMIGIEWIIGTDLLRQGAISLYLRSGRIGAAWK